MTYVFTYIPKAFSKVCHTFKALMKVRLLSYFGEVYLVWNSQNKDTLPKQREKKKQSAEQNLVTEDTYESQDKNGD